jgi:hypothetical protein
MAAKKVTKKPAINKSAFVRSLPSTMSGADVVAKAKAQGVKISLAYVYGIRAKSKAKRRTGADGIVKRGPGRPRKVVAAAAPEGLGVAPAREARTVGGLVAEIERIVEAKVVELLKAKLGSIFR